MKLCLLSALILAVLLPLHVSPQARQGQVKSHPPPQLPKLPELPSKQPTKRTKAKRSGMRSADEPLVNDPGRDLIQRFPVRNPFLGTWRVTRISHERQVGTSGRGYAIFTRAYVSIHLYQPPPVPQAPPRIQSSIRTYRIVGTELHTQAAVGFRNAANGDVLIEPPGLVERRRFQFLAPNLLRIYQARENYIELKRVERLD